MASKELFIADERMLKLVDYILELNYKGYSTQRSVCEAIGVHEVSIHMIRKGTQGFTTRHINAAANKFGVNINWIFGHSDRMFKKEGSESVIDLLKQAIAALETPPASEIKKQKVKKN